MAACLYTNPNEHMSAAERLSPKFHSASFNSAISHTPATLGTEIYGYSASALITSPGQSNFIYLKRSGELCNTSRSQRRMLLSAIVTLAAMARKEQYLPFLVGSSGNSDYLLLLPLLHVQE